MAGDFRIRPRATSGRVAAAAPSAYLHVRESGSGIPPGADSIVDLPVAFRVKNVNTSRVPCMADGADYEIRGHLVAPASAHSAVMLFLHGGVVGELGTFRFADLPGYDYGYEQAKLGHASVTIDRLGYGSSGIPNGLQVCIGSEADIAHQIVGQLRGGGYAAGSGRGPAFHRVALAAHSYGGLIAPVEAYSFNDIDALFITSSAFDQGTSAEAAAEAGTTVGVDCAHGGDPKRAGAPSGYGYSFNDRSSLFFSDAEPGVAEGLSRLRERDSCGTSASVFATLVADRTGLGTVSVPLLLVFGDHDAIFPPPSGERQRDLYTSSTDVTLIMVANAGHTLLLERTAPATRAKISAWLSRHGF
jgi:pimeloyl-ACP methyl ester carboxylesterase